MHLHRKLAGTVLASTLALEACAGGKSGSARPEVCAMFACSASGGNSAIGANDAGSTGAPGPAGTTANGGGGASPRSGGAGGVAPGGAPDAGRAAGDGGAPRDASAPASHDMPGPDAGSTMAGKPGSQTIGKGDINAPALGPVPSEASKIGGASFVLVKNWDFGTNGTIPDIATLSAEFQYHDQFNTIGNGMNYGALIVAPSSATAISGQPVEDPARPYREMTADSIGGRFGSHRLLELAERADERWRSLRRTRSSRVAHLVLAVPNG